MAENQVQQWLILFRTLNRLRVRADKIESDIHTLQTEYQEILESLVSQQDHLKLRIKSLQKCLSEPKKNKLSSRFRQLLGADFDFDEVDGQRPETTTD